MSLKFHKINPIELNRQNLRNYNNTNNYYNNNNNNNKSEDNFSVESVQFRNELTIKLCNELGLELYVTNRSPDKGQELAKAFGGKFVSQAELDTLIDPTKLEVSITWID
jgi:hypothetical protein